MRILVAETDLLLLGEIKQVLEQAGYEVIASADGLTAWGCLVNPTPPDLLITRIHLGLGMPPGTALGFYAQFCRPRIPVLYIPATIERAEYADPEHGAILIKPFSTKDLLATINPLLGG